MDKKWIETVSKLQTYEISPFEINKCIIEFAKALLELEKQIPDPNEPEDPIPTPLVEEVNQATLDFSNSEHVV